MAKKLRQNLIAQIEMLGKEGEGPTEIGKTIGIFPYIIPSIYYKLKYLDILTAESV